MTSLTCKAGPYASLCLSFPSRTHRPVTVTQRTLEGQSDAKAPEEKRKIICIRSRLHNVKEGGLRLAGPLLRTARTRTPNSRTIAGGPGPGGPTTPNGRQGPHRPRRPFPLARTGTDLWSLPWGQAPRTPAPPASLRRRFELPSGGGGAGSAQAAAAARPPARAAVAAAAALVFGGNRGDPRSPRADWASSYHVTVRLGTTEAPELPRESCGFHSSSGFPIDIPAAGERAPFPRLIIGCEHKPCEWG
jgi:hypothetical protein